MATKYTSVTVSGYNSSPPSDDGTSSEANKVKWSNHKNKIGDPLKTAIEAVNTRILAALDTTPSTKTSNYTTTASDHDTAILATSGVTISLGDATSMATGYIVAVKNNAASGTVTVGRITSGNNINGAAANVVLYPKQVAIFVCDGSHYYTIGGDLILDGSDPTKQATFNLSGLPTGTVVELAPTAAGRLRLPRMSISGLVMSNNSGDANNDIDISAGECRDSTDAHDLVLSASLTKRIDASWAVGTNNGGLDGSETSSGTPDVSTWYYLHLIKRSDTGVVDALFSESASSPSLPTNYTHSRLIGAVYNDSSGNLLPFHAYETGGGGLRVMWDSPTLDVNLSNTLGTSRRSDAVRVPAITVLSHLNVRLLDSSIACFAYISSPDATDVAPSATAAPGASIVNQSTTTTQWTQLQVMTNSSGQIAARGSTASIDEYQVVTLGFEWGRR